MIQKRKRYKILVGCNLEELKRVLTILFSTKQFVFHGHYRYRNIDDVIGGWLFDIRPVEWKWLKVGHEECAATFDGMFSWDLFDVPNYETVTVEQFLKINGYTDELIAKIVVNHPTTLPVQPAPRRFIDYDDDITNFECQTSYYDDDNNLE